MTTGYILYCYLINIFSMNTSMHTCHCLHTRAETGEPECLLRLINLGQSLGLNQGNKKILMF